MQLLAVETNAALAEQQAQANYAIARAQALASERNADLLEQRALAGDANNRDQIRRNRQDYVRIQGEQRAAIAASGVVESSGSPLDVIAETAAQIQTDQQDLLYANQLARDDLFREADLERLGGSLALAGATLNRDSEVAGAGLAMAAGRLQARQNRSQANFTRLTGQANASASRMGALTSLFAGTSRGITNAYRQDDIGALTQSGRSIF